MKKYLIIIILSIFTLISNFVSCQADEETTLKVREGTFVKVISRDEFSTLTADVEDEVSFINLQDMYVYETNAIPANTIFYGEIEEVLEPVEGKDGAMKIAINKMITPDKKVYKINAHIYSENDNYIGGKNTGSTYYHKVPHYIQGLQPMLQVAPLNVFDVGKHTIVKPGSEFFIILEKDIILK
jgi:hypothetical protein